MTATAVTVTVTVTFTVTAAVTTSAASLRHCVYPNVYGNVCVYSIVSQSRCKVWGISQNYSDSASIGFNFADFDTFTSKTTAQLATSVAKTDDFLISGVTYSAGAGTAVQSKLTPPSYDLSDVSSVTLGSDADAPGATAQSNGLQFSVDLAGKSDSRYIYLRRSQLYR